MARTYVELASGIVGETITTVSRRLLPHDGGLRGLFRMDVAKLVRIRDLGDAQLPRLKATLEPEHVDVPVSLLSSVWS